VALQFVGGWYFIFNYQDFHLVKVWVDKWLRDCFG